MHYKQQVATSSDPTDAPLPLDVDGQIPEAQSPIILVFSTNKQETYRGGFPHSISEK